ncbi:MAG: PfkB family carbohydrate kinase [Marinifilaceae bacterium]
MRNIYTIGDTVLDILFKDDKPVEAKPGGALLNTAVSLGRLGANVAMVGDFANDPVGDIIKKFLKKNHVNTDHITIYDDAKSRLALAFLDEENNAEWSFYKIRKDSKAHVEFPANVKDNDIVLFGSFYGIKEEIREGLVAFLRYARNQGAILIYDPNFRPAHLPILENVLPYIKENMQLAHIVKGSNEDFELITNLKTSEEVKDWMQTFTDAHLIYTANKDGVKVHANRFQGGFDVPKIETLSTVGAGDTFNAAIAFSILQKDMTREGLNEAGAEFWEELVTTAVCFSQEVCMSYDNYISEKMAGEYQL